MKLTNTIWPVLAIVAGGLLLRKQKQTSGVGEAAKYTPILKSINEEEMQRIEYPAWSKHTRELLDKGFRFSYKPGANVYTIYKRVDPEPIRNHNGQIVREYPAYYALVGVIDGTNLWFSRWGTIRNYSTWVTMALAQDDRDKGNFSRWTVHEWNPAKDKEWF